MTTVHVVIERPEGQEPRVVGVFTDRALAARVTGRRPNRVILAGPADREWGRPR